MPASAVYNAPLILDGKEYMLDPQADIPHKREQVKTQPGDRGRQFSQRIENFALGWGYSKMMEPNTYDYGLPALLHRRLSFLPGCVITEYTPATVPIGPTSFCEYWDGSAANRRLIIVSPRHVYEITPSGTVSTNDLGANFTTSRAMTQGVLFKNAAGGPNIYIARQSATATDYFVTRSAANTYALTASDFRADAIAVGKDSTGANVLWIVDPDAKGGELRQLVADADPEIDTSWGGTTYPIGEVSLRTNGLLQQSKRLLCFRPDGAFTFDNVARSTPITPGAEATLDALNGYNPKDFNGMAVVATVAGLMWVDGLEWGFCGPVSANRDARNIADVREVAFASAGDYAYSATWDGADCYVYLGTIRSERNTGSGSGPFVWHGPIAHAEGVQITDLRVSTVWGNKLWIGFADGFGAIDLLDDFSPEPNETAGYIYLPEGILDRSGPQVTKQVHSVEYIAPASVPFDADNTWELQMDFGAGYVGPGVANSGSYQKRTFSVERSARRPLARLAYTSDGTAELEAVVVSGIELPEWRWHHIFRIRADETSRKPGGARTWRHPRTVEEDLAALNGWTGVIRWGEESFTGEVVSVAVDTKLEGRHSSPTRFIEVEIAEVP